MAKKKASAESLSPLSSEIQAMAMGGVAPLIDFNHSVTNVVLPNPAGAEMMVNFR